MSTTALKRPLKRRDKEYKGSSNDYFKTPRSTSQTIYVGGAPQTPAPEVAKVRAKAKKARLGN